MPERSGPNRVGHEPPLANARTGGSLAEVGQCHYHRPGSPQAGCGPVGGPAERDVGAVVSRPGDHLTTGACRQATGLGSPGGEVASLFRTTALPQVLGMAALASSS